MGKIYDIFAGRGFSDATKTVNNDDGMRVATEWAKKEFSGLCFVNLVDFDMVYGHRNDVAGYAAAMTKFDGQLAEFLPLLTPQDILIITADHGCDPVTPSTDHSREYTPMLLYGAGVQSGADLGTRSSFADISATVLEFFGVPQRDTKGTSFWKQVQKEGGKQA